MSKPWKQEFKIGSRLVGLGHPIFVIAEAGVNHNGDLSLAKELVDVAAEAGADAVKFQSFKTESLSTLKAPKAQYHIETTGRDASQSWFELLKSQEMNVDMHYQLVDYCQKKGIEFLSTPYDIESLELLLELNVPAIKVASTDANNIPFLRAIARTGKPLLFSTAMSHLNEVEASLKAISAEGCDEAIVFQCTGNYPTKNEDANIRIVKTFRDKFNMIVGLSDHTMDAYTAAVGAGMGMMAYERHFTIDRKLAGPDHRMSVTPSELKELVTSIRTAERLLGHPDKKVLDCESDNRLKLRKSLVASKDLSVGHIISAEDLAIKRPGTGLAPIDFDSLLGRTLSKNVNVDHIFAPNDFK